MIPESPKLAPLMPLHDALAALTGRLAPTPAQRTRLPEAVGGVLAEDIRADRPSPPADVSAMDGYAVRTGDSAILARDGLPISGEVETGAPVMGLPSGAAMRIFTGGAVPLGADAVVKREDTIESPERVLLGPASALISKGMNIRRVGENARAGDLIVSSGAIVSPSVTAALASFGVTRPMIRRRVRVSILVTGDEVGDASDSITATRIRDSNGPMLTAMLGGLGWIHIVRVGRVADDPVALREALGAALDDADCVFTSGGVSMGDHDHVPAIAASLGGDTVFHRLSIKPGKPVFSAVFEGGRALLGLPGNPVSALVTARVIGLPALATLAGAPSIAVGPSARCTAVNPETRALSMTRFVLAERVGADRVRLIAGKGSGDVAALARSHGVAQIPSGDTGAGPFDYYSWRIS